MEQIWSFLTKPKVIVSGVITIVTIIIFLILQKTSSTYSRSGKGQGEKAAAIRLALDVTRILILCIAIVIVFRINGINVVSLVTGLGIAGVVIGLAMQDVIKDIIMGLYVVVYHFYAVGECVEYQGREGMIIAFNLKTTKIGDLEDHSVLTVCNRDFTEIRRIADRMDIDLPLPYDVGLPTVRTLLDGVCRQIEDSDKSVTRCKFLGLERFGDSAVLYKLRIHCAAKDRPGVRRAALGIIFEALNAAGISIPYEKVSISMEYTDTHPEKN